MINEQRGEAAVPPEIKTQDHLIIYQPEGVEIHISGSRENLSVISKSPDGEFSFNDIPPKTRFEFHGSPFVGFQHNVVDGEHVILIPPERAWQEKEPVIQIFHEKGHAKSQQDQGWREKLKNARQELALKLFLAEIDGVMLFSSDPVKREQEHKTLTILYQEERRASAYALWLVRQLRKKGVDPVPHRKTAKELKDAIEEAFKTHVLPELVLTVKPKKPHLPIKSGF